MDQTMKVKENRVCTNLVTKLGNILCFRKNGRRTKRRI